MSPDCGTTGPAFSQRSLVRPLPSLQAHYTKCWLHPSDVDILYKQVMLSRVTGQSRRSPMQHSGTLRRTHSAVQTWVNYSTQTAQHAHHTTCSLALAYVVLDIMNYNCFEHGVCGAVLRVGPFIVRSMHIRCLTLRGLTHLP